LPIEHFRQPILRMIWLPLLNLSRPNRIASLFEMALTATLPLTPPDEVRDLWRS
jgi:hypothetical protein